MGAPQCAALKKQIGGRQVVHGCFLLWWSGRCVPLIISQKTPLALPALARARNRCDITSLGIVLLTQAGMR
jgi:hypothetical protein